MAVSSVYGVSWQATKWRRCREGEGQRLAKSEAGGWRVATKYEEGCYGHCGAVRTLVKCGNQGCLWNGVCVEIAVVYDDVYLRARVLGMLLLLVLV